MCGFLLTWPATQACARTGNQTSDPLVCSPALNPLSRTSQGWLVLFSKNIVEEGRDRSQCAPGWPGMCKPFAPKQPWLGKIKPCDSLAGYK